MKTWIQVHQCDVTYAEPKWRYGIARFKTLTVQAVDGPIVLKKVFAGKSVGSIILEDHARALAFICTKTTNYLIAVRTDKQSAVDTSVVSWSRTTIGGGFDPSVGGDLASLLWYIPAAPFLLISYLRFRPVKDLSERTDWRRVLELGAGQPNA